MHCLAVGAPQSLEQPVEALAPGTLGLAAQGVQRVEELLGAQATDERSAENKLPRVARRLGNGGQGVGTGSHDDLECVLQVEPVFDEVRRQPIQDLAAPGGVGQLIHGFDEPVSEQARPQTVHGRPGEQPVPARADGRCQLLHAFASRCVRIDLAQLGEGESGRREFPCRDLGAVHFEGLFRVHARQSPGVGLLPVVDQAVVAGRTLQADAQEHLRHVLGGLNLHRGGRERLGGADTDTLDEPGRVPLCAVELFLLPIGIVKLAGRGDQFAGESVVGNVLRQCVKKPVGDGPHVVMAFAQGISPFVHALGPVPQQVLPEGHPTGGVVLVAGEQRPRKPYPLVRTRVLHEGPEPLRCGQQADRVQVGAAREDASGDRPWHFAPNLFLLEIGTQEAIQRWPVAGGDEGTTEFRRQVL